MKARIAARSGKPLLKVELWMEFYNASKVYSFHSYEAIVRPTDSRLKHTNQTSPEPIISDKGRLVELSFNVTDIYHTSKLLGKKYVHFRIKIHGYPKKATKELQGATDIKAFLIIHEFEEICNEYFPVRRPGRYKRSPHTKPLLDQRLFSKSRGVRHVFYGHQLQKQPTSTLGSTVNALRGILGTNPSGQNHPQRSQHRRHHSKSGRPRMTHKSRHRLQKPHEAIRTMMSNLSSILDRSIYEQKLLKRRSSRPILKSLHPDSNSNTRTSCGLNDWYVSFDYIGWDNWVIAPSGVRARTCSGVCSFPMGSDINSTAHAHLQSFVYYFKGEKWPACCVPNDFEPLTMILYDVTDQLPFMAKYPNMIATNCACL